MIDPPVDLPDSHLEAPASNSQQSRTESDTYVVGESATATPPAEGPQIQGMRTASSLVLVNTGDGKGKSTAAFGVIIRAVAQGWPVGVVQFLKSGDWNVGEERLCRETLGVDWWAMGDGFSWDSENLKQDEAIAQKAWSHARDVITADQHRLVVLDEITYLMNWGWISTDEVLATLRNRPTKVNVILTGRDASQALIDVADTVTEMKSIKHAFDVGIVAKKGIDY